MQQASHGTESNDGSVQGQKRRRATSLEESAPAKRSRQEEGDLGVSTGANAAARPEAVDVNSTTTKSSPVSGSLLNGTIQGPEPVPTAMNKNKTWKLEVDSGCQARVQGPYQTMMLEPLDLIVRA